MGSTVHSRHLAAQGFQPMARLLAPQRCYYVEKYEIEVPEDFLRHVRRLGWQARSVSRVA